MKYYSNDHIKALAISECGERSQKTFATDLGVSPQYLNDFLSGRVAAGPMILRGLGFEERPFYRKIER